MGGKENNQNKIWQKTESYNKELISQITEKILSLDKKHETLPDDGPESFIFVSEATCPGTNQFMPLVSDWRLSEEENGRCWVAVPHLGLEKGTWDAEVIQTAKRAEIPEPTIDVDHFTSILTGQTFSRDQLEKQIQKDGLRKKLIAVSYHDANKKLVFRKPTEEENEESAKAEHQLTKLVYQNNDSRINELMEDTLKTRELSFKQKMILYIVNQAKFQLFQDIDKNEEPQTAREIKDLLLKGTGMFLLKNIMLENWDPKQKKALVSKRHDQLDNFPFTSEIPLFQVPKQLEASIDSNLHEFKNICQLLGPKDLEPFIILHPREIEEPMTEASSLATIVIKAEDVIHFSKEGYEKQNRGMGENFRIIEFLTDDLLARVRRGTNETVDKEARKNKFTETFSDIKKYLKDDGVLTVLCDEKCEETVDDVQESLKKAGFEIEGNWELVGTDSESPGRVVVGRKRMG